MSGEFKGFKRVNFFRGFQTTAEDWNDLVNYDVEKVKLHNKLFHGPGVVSGFLGALKVSARGRADLSVEVAPGYALDGQGNLIYLSEPEIKTIDPSEFKLPQTVYLVLRYLEDLTDFVSYRSNLDYKGHRRIAERVKVDAIITEPDVDREIEIARIHLTKDVKRITDAKDSTEPKANEIDTRYIPYAGVIGTRLTPAMLRDFSDLLEESRRVYAHMFHALQILPAGDVVHAFITLEFFLRLNFVDRANIFKLCGLLFDLQDTLVRDIETNYPQYSSKKEFASYKKHIELLLTNYAEGTETDEFLINILGYERKGTQNLMTLFGSQARTKKKEVAPSAAAAEAIFEKIKVRSEDFGNSLEIDGVKLKLVDSIDVLEKRSEKDHKFRIVDAQDRYRTRQKLKYPDGVIVEDVGIAFEGGHVEFEVSNVVPNKELIIINRMDYVHGDWEAEVHVNGKKVGAWICEGDDRKFRWRNWPYKVTAEYVGDTFLTIRVVPVTADRDLNMFKLWFYQPK